MPERPDLQIVANRFPGWVYDLGLSAPELALYGVYASYVAQGGGDTVNLPMRDICERLNGATPETVVRWRAVLAAKGAISVVRQFGAEGRSLPPLVTLPRTPQPVDNPVDNVETNNKNVAGLARVAEKAATPNQDQDQVPNQIKGLNQGQGLSTKEHYKELSSSPWYDPTEGNDLDRDNPNTQTSQEHYNSKIITLGLQNSTVQPEPGPVKGEEDDFSQKVPNDEETIRRAFARIASKRFAAAQAEGRIDSTHGRNAWVRRTIENLHAEHGDEARQKLETLRADTEVDRLVSALTPDLLAAAVTDLAAGGKGPPPIPYYQPAVSDAEYGPYCTPAENVAWVRKIRANPRKYNTNPPTPDPPPQDAA